MNELRFTLVQGESRSRKLAAEQKSGITNSHPPMGFSRLLESTFLTKVTDGQEQCDWRRDQNTGCRVVFLNKDSP